LKWVWLHGAKNQSIEKRIKLTNEPANLLSVEAKLNRQKGTKGLDEWLPPRNQCQYIVKFIRIKNIFGLILSDTERSVYTAQKNKYCAD
jgi:hypothetical protein